MDDDEHVVRPNEFEVRSELAELRRQHRELDAEIRALHSRGQPDPLQLQRLKKRKLVLKDRISVLEDKLLPDIIA